MSDSNNPTTENTIKAVRVVLGLLPQIAGLVVGLLAIAYVTGSQEASAYYGGLGAGWVMSLLTTTQVMQLSVSHISLIAISLFYSIYGITEGEYSLKGLRITSIVFMGISLLLFLATSFTNNDIKLLLAICIGVSWSIAAGVMLGELVGSLAMSELRWNSYHVHLLYIVAFWGLLYSSYFVGMIRADSIIDGDSSSLPVVLINDPSEKMEWRLVSPVGEQILLTSVQGATKTRKFKLVTSSEIQEIGSTRNSDASTSAH